MKKMSIGLLGIFVYSAVLNADGFSESDKNLIAGKDFPFPTQDEAQIPETDTSADDSQGWNSDQQTNKNSNPQNNGKNTQPSGKSKEEYAPEVDDDENTNNY